MATAVILAFVAREAVESYHESSSSFKPGSFGHRAESVGSLTSRASYDVARVLFLVVGIIMVTVGMSVGLGKIGDALVLNNPDTGYFNAANVSPTMTVAGLIIGFFVAVGSAFMALAIRRWK